MDNISQQADEVEALSSIYEDEWVSENQNNSYSIQVAPNVKLFITLPPEYPTNSAPKYDLLAPELSLDDKNKIHKDFKKIFEENPGEPILFQCIEKLKETVCNITKKTSNSVKIEQPASPNEGDKEKTQLLIEKYSKSVVHGQIIEDRKSVFQGHCCSVYNEEDVKNVLEYLMDNKKIAQATHNMYAYRIKKNSSHLQDCEDDGENHASKRLLHLLQILNLENIVVVVSRWYGGIQLGPDRFKHITNSARQVLVEAGFIQ